MKTPHFLLFIASLLIAAGCKSGTSSTVSGIYVTSFKQEFSIGFDTLIIEAYNLAAGTYQIKRHSGYHPIRDGKILSKEYKQRSWMATFDQDKQVLQETAFGQQIYLDPDHHSLSFRGSQYKLK